MATHPPPVLDADDLNKTDRRILKLLRDGRVTPPLVSDRLDLSREYASERLIRMHEHDHVDRPAPGLYELVNDPLDKQSDIDTAAIRRAVDDLEAACGRGDSATVRDAIKRLRELVGGE